MDKLIYLVPGFISYIVLRPFRLFNFQSDTDRQLTLIILSLINSGLSTALASYFWKNSIIAIFASAIIITVIYFILFTVYNKYSRKLADLWNINLYDNMGTMEHSLSQNFKGKEQFVISFDFNNNYIASGYVRNIDDQGNQQIELYGDGEDTFTIDEAKDAYKNNGDPLDSIIVDYKNKIKTYVILYPC
jgi:FlaA1/EpsC-like NDP-sugar epimerase